MFSKDSRYLHIKDQQKVCDNGAVVTYKARRFIPQVDAVPSDMNLVSEGQRIDWVSYSTLGNPKLYWRFGDANEVFSPMELEQKGLLFKVPSDGNNR